MNFTEDTTGTAGQATPTVIAPVNAVTGISIADADADPASHIMTVTLSVGTGTLTIRTDVTGGLVSGNVAGNGTASLVLTGTQNAINATLAATTAPAQGSLPNGLVYTPVPNFHGATNLTIVTNDNGGNGNDPAMGTGTGTSEADTDTKVLNVADVNDAPTVSGDGTEEAPSILEDTPWVNGTAMTVAQLFAGQFSDALDNQHHSVSNPTGSTGDTFAGIAVIAGSSSAAGSWQFLSDGAWIGIGSVSLTAAKLINAATLIRFSPAANYNGPATSLVVHLVESQAAFGDGISQNLTTTGGTTRYSANTVTLSQAITAVNDAPVLSQSPVTSPTYTENGASVQLLVGGSVTDVDATNFAGGGLTVSVSGTNNILSLPDANGFTGSNTALAYNGTKIADLARGDSLVLTNFTAAMTPAVLNLLLDNFYLSINSEDPGSADRTVTFTLDDGGNTGTGGAKSGQITQIVKVVPVDDVPTVTVSSNTRAFVEGVNGSASAIFVDSGVTLADPDNASFAFVQVIFQSGYVAGQDVLAFVNNNSTLYGDISASVNSTTGWLSLSSASGTATKAQFQAAARAVTYDNISEEPSTGTRQLQIRALNGSQVSGDGGVSVTVTPRNDSPSGTSGTIAINEDATRTLTVADFGFTDVDGDVLQAVRFGSAPTGGTLFYDADGTGTGNAAVAIVTFPSANFSAADVAAGKLTFVPVANLNGTGAGTITFTVIDNGGTAGGGNDTDVTPNVLTLDIAAVNDEPAGADNGDTTLDTTTLVFDAANFSTGFTDPEGNSFAGVVITTLPPAAQGKIQLGGVDIAGLQFVTLAQLNNGDLTFVPVAGQGGTTPTFTFQVRDNGGVLNSGQDTDQSPNTFTVTIAASNVAPVLDLDADGTGTGFASAYTEGGAAAAISDTDALITDADAGDDVVGATITISNAVTDDVLKVVGALPGSITVDPSSTSIKLILTGTGTRAQYEAALEQVTFSNTGDNPTAGGTNGSRTITVVVTDGDAASNTATATISVADDNADAPSGTSSTITAVEDSFRLIKAGDLGFSDPDGTFASVTISGVSGGGIYFDADGSAGAGAPVLEALPKTYTAQDLIDGKVSFKAASNASGSGIGTITFAVTDDDGNTDGTPNALTVNVTPVNDAPVLDTSAGDTAYTEGNTPVVIDSGATVGDVDGLVLAGQVQITNGSAGDLLTFTNNDPALFGDIVLEAGSSNTVLNLRSSSGTATLQQWENALRAVTYSTTSDNPSTTTRIVAFIVNDGTDFSSYEYKNITITAVNDAPVLDLNGAATGAGTTAEYTEQAGSSILAAGLVIADADDTNIEGATLTITSGLQAALDVLTVNGATSGNSGSISWNYSGQTGVLTLTGSATVAAYQALLRQAGFESTSDAPGASRTITWKISDGSADSNLPATTITVTATQDPAVAQPDDVSTPENQVLNGNLFADNGNGIDADPDGEAVTISEVNGQAANVGTTITLASGAKLTVNADGTFSYDPNGKFNDLTDNSSGASNTSAEDSFTYRLATGNAVTVTVTVNGVAGTNDQLRGDAGNNTITGSPQGNLFLLDAGGNDTAYGLAGDDTFYFGAAYTTADTVDGGEGIDTLGLHGVYGGLVFGANSLAGIERIGLYSSTTSGQPGPFSYYITTHDGNVAAGESLFVTAAGLKSNETLTFLGMAETDGSFRVHGGAGADLIVGGGGNDFLIGNGGNDYLSGKGGDDYLVGGAGQDELRGGFGSDVFRFLAASDSTLAAPDRILDFQYMEKIDLSAMDANSNLDGDQAFTFIGDATFTAAGQVRATYDAGTKLWSVTGDINGDGNADFLILVSRPNAPLPIVAGEFFL